MSNRVGVCDKIRSYITPSGKSKTDCFLTQGVALCFILSLFQREFLYDELIIFPGRGNIIEHRATPYDKERNLYNNENPERVLDKNG